MRTRTRPGARYQPIFRRNVVRSNVQEVITPTAMILERPNFLASRVTAVVSTRLIPSVDAVPPPLRRVELLTPQMKDEANQPMADLPFSLFSNAGMLICCQRVGFFSRSPPRPPARLCAVTSTMQRPRATRD